MIPFDLMVQAQAYRAAVRATMMEELRSCKKDLPKAVLALLEADARATEELRAAMALVEPLGAIVNGSVSVEL